MNESSGAPPKVSVLVAVYDMVRAARRTLTSLTPAYQECVDPKDYEVIVVENPSVSCFTQAKVEAYGASFSYKRSSEVRFVSR